MISSGIMIFMPPIPGSLGWHGRHNSCRPLRAWNLGLTLAVGMALFTGLGWSVDRYRGRGPIGILTGAGLGVIFIGYELWRLFRNELLSDENKAANGSPVQPETTKSDLPGNTKQ